VKLPHLELDCVNYNYSTPHTCDITEMAECQGTGLNATDSRATGQAITDNLATGLATLDLATADKKREEYLEWNEYFMAVSFLSAMRSKDPATQVKSLERNTICDCNWLIKMMKCVKFIIL